jgi:hypothetical protein
VLAIEEVERDLHTACRMATVLHWYGAPWWRVLLFVMLYSPLRFAADVLARALVAIVVLLVRSNLWQGNVRYLAYSVVHQPWSG